MVFAEASWYGSIRGGWESNTAGGEESGYSSFGSRWGIKGSSEVSEGLNAVYKFETRISDGGQTTNQLYTGLSGGFGTVTLGKMPNAAHVHAGFVDNSQHYGTSELASKEGDTISYSVDVGAASFQVDAIADSGMKGKDADSAQFGATVRIGDNAKVGFGYISYATMDADTPVYEVEESFETETIPDSAAGKVVKVNKTAAKTAVPEAHLDKDNQAQIAGQYSIGGVTLHLGYGERKKDTDSKAASFSTTSYGPGLKGGDLLDAKHKTTFFGFAGGLGDTGFAYNFQMRSKKNTKNMVKASYRDNLSSAGLLDRDGALLTDNGLGCVNATQRIDDQREDDESEVHDIKLVEAREHSAEALEPPEQAFHLVAPPVHFPVVFPGRDAAALRRHHGCEAEVGCQPAGLIVLIGPIHDERRAARRPLQPLQELPPLRGIVRVAGREREGHGGPIIRGSQMKLGVPPAPGLADALGAVFFSAPVPSGCTLMLVLSRLRTSTRMRIIRSRCRRLSTRSRTPFLDHRLMRV